LLALSLVSGAWAYGDGVHAALTEQALRPLVGEAQVPVASAEQVDALLLSIDTWARTSAHAAAWAARYPQPPDFDRWAFKELLLLNPDREVYGVDRFDEETSMLAVLSVSARRPDDDYRNRERLAHNPDRSARPGVPDDPIILNMGTLGAISSQAHAHYGLDQLEFSSDPDVLQSDPPRFAVAVGWPAGPVLTLAPEMAQTHINVATLAFLAGHDGLGASWFGAALHYVEDVSNPIHTVQVGLYDFFQDAFFERWRVSARTGGGYFGELPTLATIGIGSISNHHTISEQYTERYLLNGDDELVAAINIDDAALLAALPNTADSDWALAATRALVHVSAPHGAPMYAATRAIVRPEYRSFGVKFDDQNDAPEAAVRPDLTPADREAFFVLQREAFSRGATTVRALWKLEADQLASARASKKSISSGERRRVAASAGWSHHA